MTFKFNGKPFIDKMSDDDYNQLPMLRSSDLKNFCKSPAHYRWHRDNREERSVFDVGRYVHALVLEPETLDDHFAICEMKTRTTKDYHLVKARNPGKTVILEHEKEMCQKIAENMMADPTIASLIEAGHSEIAAGVKISDVWACCKMDKYIPETRTIVDLKSTSESAYWFPSVVRKYQYDISAAWYMDVINGAALELGQTEEHGADNYILIAMEKQPPYLSRVVVLTSDYLSFARSRYQAVLPTFRKCLETNIWQGYDNSEPMILDAPKTFGTDSAMSSTDE